MNPSQDFNRLYTNVSKSISITMAELTNLKVDHKEGKQEIGNMMARLRAIQIRFDDELGLLEKHAEWDKFTMAFFGETNAGKSTIIESLRILFNEDSRQALLQKNAHDLAKYEQELIGHTNQVREGLNKIYAEYTAEIVAIQHSVNTLARVLLDESSTRIKSKLRLYAAVGALVGAVSCGVIIMLLRVAI